MKLVYEDLWKKHGMLWRYAPMTDPAVVEWHSRDIDARISQRKDCLTLLRNFNILSSYEIAGSTPRCWTGATAGGPST